MARRLPVPRRLGLPRLAASLAILLLMLGLAAPASAWWEYGHQTVASIAMQQVQPRTRASIVWLLRRQAVLETPTCPAHTIEEASIWPDCIKTLGDRFNYAYVWHFQDAEICQPFDLKAACANGNCVSAQIARARRMLADRKLPPRDRLMALAFLVHFVGDLHQPLHGSEHDGDQGGNRVKASYGARTGTNLHSIWDGLLADRAISSPPGGADGILSGITPEDRKAIAAGTIDDWGRESWALAKTQVYGSVEADICKPTPKTPVTMDEATIERLVPVVRLQIARGGLRLARLLDEALDGDHPEVAHPPRPPRTVNP
ncbi:S1/P1 nuclease [Sphingomonas bacterium]|uniref:S1/P1 nuclease n=1 Tax=Sphingomonas bacterium TaxID=1895847 RepID=UPI001574FF93|nr:S1/P1 nuclease [Sphingomonas bacterium]